MTLEDVEKGRPGREPVARMLCEVKEHTHVNFKLLHRIVEYQLFDIDRGPMNTMSELEVYGENTRGLMLYLNLHLLAIDNKEANLAASHLGRCLGICDVIKKVPYYLAVQRGYIPNDVLVRHNL
jgi:phytoene/squalene synthetase